MNWIVEWRVDWRVETRTECLVQPPLLKLPEPPPVRVPKQRERRLHLLRGELGGDECSYGGRREQAARLGPVPCQRARATQVAFAQALQ